MALAATAVAQTEVTKVYSGPIATRWGKTVTPENAWRSYPRPQMKRGRWVNLNGLWDYAIRPKAALLPATMDGKVLVPFAVESKLSGVTRSVTPADRLWYRRSFTVPSEWKDERTLLHFGAVDYESEVMVNGSVVGSHRGGSDPFTFDITDYLKPGSNDLVVQVLDPTSTGAQPRGKQQLKPEGIWYTPVTGIWQTVWLEPVPSLHLEDVNATPDIDGATVAVDVVLNHAATDEDVVRITALAAGRAIASTTVRANRRAVLPIGNPHLWSPDDPYLYDLKVELLRLDKSPFLATQSGGTRDNRRDRRYTREEALTYSDVKPTGKPLDAIESYFAMRKSSIGPGPVPGQPSLLLNNRPVFQNGTLDQGWWPDGLLTPPSEEAIRWELSYLKQAGFNMLRKHIKVEPAQYYYEADRLGILIWQDMPSGEEAGSGDQFVTPGSQDEALLPMAAQVEIQDELTRMVLDLRSHPSIVTWVVNNEGWGQHASTRLAQLVKALDPTRVVNKTSGWLDTGDKASDIFDIHTYGEVPDVPLRHTERAIAIGEYGGIGLPIEGHLWFPGRNNWGYQTAKDQADYEVRYQRKMQEIIRQSKYFGLSAAVYTQTTDVEGEVNGLLTYDREVSKLPPERLKQISDGLVTH
ncbi:glycoside hydrolase family 2 protein [Terriglobus sp.]|uniref:glycoside hydrolase family 2 protein n=1 Tax=Terriglobus sp. TaxID=1889013 RepID=UPI003B005F62